ncbi:MAG: DUF1858 domain-containing protein [Candidatus Latescibacteria bacterium]|nr:DUF1858 domain-containing protein [Candidatus Latescibacterota bacterium]NIM66362.1 DUF1858 domain-containing protein [Candidatus Latescibacterota bacterium]NIO02841.1 DUF1858 domain-containing protein [Candidatus Latescibacterota bacterium]NIO29976.1 DUF1858 domain-containing protein [Candidatus Latescibacterota bacterium]NIO57591.1 DUF1858 domain-containing protein [Candidatus Latescibacterota bacterium]
MKGFIVSSLIYFLLGAIIGLLMGISPQFFHLQFTHVHFNLLGFMAMMIYGVGYFILPRFNAKPLKWPRLVPLHFYLANTGLIGMCLFHYLNLFSSSEVMASLFVFFAVVEAFSVFLFVVNVITVLTGRVAAATATEGRSSGAGAVSVAQGSRAKGQTKPAGGVRPPASQNMHLEGRKTISPNTRVGEILERYPGSERVLGEAGIRALLNPAHAEQVKKLPVTLRAACERHGVDLDALINELEAFVTAGEPEAAESVRKTAGTAHDEGGYSDSEGSASGPITAGMLIGETLQHFPQTEAVFKKYFGNGCFDCPGQVTESIAQGALLHNVDPDALVRELNDVMRRG